MLGQRGQAPQVFNFCPVESVFIHKNGGRCESLTGLGKLEASAIGARRRLLFSSRPALSMPWIPAEYGRVIVVSPHMDDAILSCGGLLSQLIPQMDCLTVTVCTADPVGVDPQNPPHGIALPSLRRDEEVSAMAALGCKLVQLDLLDAIYRKDVHSGQVLYPTMNSIWSMPRPEDAEHRQALRSRLLSLLGQPAQRPTLLISPLSVGHHIDHVLCTQVALSVAANLDHILLYEDFPYVVDDGQHVGIADTPQKALQRLGLTGVQSYAQECITDKKISWISHYRSQIESIFGSHDNVRPMLMKNSSNGHTVERFWKVRKSA